MRPVLANALLLLCLLIAGLSPGQTLAAESFELLSAGSAKDKRVLRYDLKVGTEQTVQTITQVRVEKSCDAKADGSRACNPAQGDRELEREGRELEN